jgi:hypothetical protein
MLDARSCNLERHWNAKKAKIFPLPLILAERQIQNRKEVKTMTYSKPELLAAEVALDAIRGAKESGNQDSIPDFPTLVAAYDVDE